jgi:hypothetical protein
VKERDRMGGIIRDADIEKTHTQTERYLYALTHTNIHTHLDINTFTHTRHAQLTGALFPLLF